MSYIDRILQPGEHLMAARSLHWIIYTKGTVLLAAGLLLGFLSGSQPQLYWPLIVIGGILALLGVLLLLSAWVRQLVTEIAITERRVIYKSGLFSRHTAEMNMDKVESVIINQSILGRLLNYGSVSVRGTGDGLEILHQIASPLALRGAITAR
jgi:uncharacterized membrane protein YdbT with pleckstrin-like domain